ncbi:MAG: prolipoprotein diacylglyceryl transferase [Cytophagales bacterium]|nr:prolipoprotein diacylglyceryl transferase [Cytophagales bacterium]
MNLFNYIIWSPNPEIFPGIDWIEVRWYGLLFAAGFIISQQLMYHIFKSEGKPQKDVDSLTLWMIISTIIGARLGHVIFYEPMRYLKDPVSILKTWEGGLASHGATIGILTAIYLYVNYLVDINPFKGRFIWKKRKREGQSYLWIVDRIVICVAVTGALIRFGNFLNAEIIGLPTRSNYGVVFAREAVDGIESIRQVEQTKVKKDNSRTIDENGHIPIEIEIEFAKSVNSPEIAGQIVKTNVKTILSNYASLHIYEPPANPMQFEINQKNGRQIALVKTKAISRHPAQLYESISTFLIFLLLLFIWNKRKEKMPEGLLFGTFLVILFGLRFAYEFIKENQVEFEDAMSLNMGQILSIPLVIIGIWILFNLKKLQPRSQTGNDKKSKMS